MGIKNNLNIEGKHALVLLASVFFALGAAQAQSYGVMTPEKSKSLSADGRDPCYRERNCNPDKKGTRDNDQDNYRSNNNYYHGGWGWNYPNNRPYNPYDKHRPHNPHDNGQGGYWKPDNSNKPRTDFKKL